MTEQFSIEQLRENPDLAYLNPLLQLATGGTKAKKGNKYGAIKTLYRGVMFDSRKEAQYAEELDLRVRAGDVKWWSYHPLFLLPGNVIYEADFMVLSDVLEIVDVKSKATRTAAYKIKRKLMRETYNIEVQEV